jgi:hypothetical protein
MAQLEEGLQWRDVDWSRRKIHLRRSRVRDRTGTPNRLLTKVLEGVWVGGPRRVSARSLY